MVHFTPTHSYNVTRGDVAYTLDERRRAALAEIDNAAFSRFHVKVACIAGIGFMTDAYVRQHPRSINLPLTWKFHSYDIFAINIASTMLGYVYGGHHNPPFKLTTNQDLGIKVATPVGTFVGQLLFGWLADIVGRKKMCKLVFSCSL
jgi:PHS family inorganic phosphate transporter-like MFS transporter